MPETLPVFDPAAVPDIPGGPYDLEFFLDPMCPFAWQTSVWARQVAGLRDLRIGWRFISLRLLNEELSKEQLSEDRRAAYLAGTRVLRLLAAAREAGGNDAVGAMYEQWGRSLWYVEREGRDFASARVDTIDGIDLGKLAVGAGLDADLAGAADDTRDDDVLLAETLLGLDRAGEGLGTPIITFGPPDGPSFFGPVISTELSDEAAIELYESLATVVRLGCFSELKRSKRPALDLPLLAG